MVMLSLKIIELANADDLILSGVTARLLSLLSPPQNDENLRLVSEMQTKVFNILISLCEKPTSGRVDVWKTHICDTLV
jgi:hypothetical protein